MSSRPKAFGKTVGDYHRPRRPSAETIRYLRSLPLELTSSLEEIRAYLNSSSSSSSSSSEQEKPPHVVEYPAALTAAFSALEEIAHEVASLAGDEHASEALELVVRLTAPFSALAARKLVTACAGYAVFLSTHRYGSHVLQTILQFAVVAETSQDLALHEDAPALSGVEELPTLSEALLVLHKELLPYMSTLAVHVCGSHILRTLCCVMGGYRQTVDPTSNKTQKRRGGKSKAKKVDKISPDARLVPIAHSRLKKDDSSIAEALEEFTTAISGSEVQPPGTLQELACDSSASPLLMVLLRVLTYRDALPASSSDETISVAEKEEDTGTNPDHHMVLIPREPRFREGSQAEALSHRLLCWQPKKGDTAQVHAGDVIYGLAGEPRGSHVLDTLFRLSPNSMYQSILTVGDFLSKKSLPEYMEHHVSNFVIQTILATLRTKEQALQISEILQANALLIVDSEKSRRGILWRWAEMAVTYPECQNKVIQGITSALESLQTNARLSKQCATTFLGIKDSPNEDRLILNVEGSRALHHLLHFQGEAVKGVVDSVLALSMTDLERLAKDGLGSRCVWDAILDEGSPAAPIRKKLLTKLKGRWVALATDRVGHHVVRKMFLALPDNGSREVLVQELSESMGRLEGNAMGRKIAALAKVREYTTKGNTEWERSVGRTIKEKEWLQDMLQSEPKVQSKDRKREAPTRSNLKEGAHEKSKRIKEMSMGDIVSAISMPQKKK
eukprot:scaffold178_cov163-Amphora_coffeaeformis.AAC.11